MFRLWKEALTLFKTAVVEHGFTYDRFRDDFINSHTFHDAADADSRNDHLVNLGRIGSLLLSRDDLVRKYCDSAMTSDDFLSCMSEYMLERPKTRSRLLNLECELSERALSVLTEAANDIPLFKRKVTVDDMRLLFNRSLSPTAAPLVANNNRVLAYFLSRLNYSAIISNKYQYVIANNRLILGSTGAGYLSQTNLSSSLVLFEESDNPVRSKIDRWVILIKQATFDS